MPIISHIHNVNYSYYHKTITILLKISGLRKKPSKILCIIKIGKVTQNSSICDFQGLN